MYIYVCECKCPFCIKSFCECACDLAMWSASPVATILRSCSICSSEGGDNPGSMHRSTPGDARLTETQPGGATLNIIPFLFSSDFIYNAVFFYFSVSVSQSLCLSVSVPPSLYLSLCLCLPISLCFFSTHFFLNFSLSFFLFPLFLFIHSFFLYFISSPRVRAPDVYPRGPRFESSLPRLPGWGRTISYPGLQTVRKTIVVIKNGR